MITFLIITNIITYFSGIYVILCLQGVSFRNMDWIDRVLLFLWPISAVVLLCVSIYDKFRYDWRK